MPFDVIHKKLLDIDAELVDEINSLLTALSGKRDPEVSPGYDFSKPKVLWEVQNYVQLSIHRVVELGEGATDAWNRTHPAICFILTRALMENVAALFDVTNQIETFVAESKFTEIHDLVVNRLMGGKLEKFPDEIRIPNILNAIDKTDKHYEVRPLYDFLCEFAHPNSLGMHGLYGSIDPATHILRVDSSFGINAKHFFVIVHSLHRTLAIFWNTVLKIEKLYPGILKVCQDDAKAHGGCT